MNEPELNLPNPPIVESVLDIECDLPPGQQLAALEGPARETFRDRYPKFRPQVTQEFQFEATPEAPLNMSLRHGIQAYQFLHDDEKQLVQVRVQGFSFNRLAPYTSLDDYLPEIERCWFQYVALAAPVQVRLIRLRYINRILLPSADKKPNLDEYFRRFPHLPDDERLVLTGFLHQYAAVEVKSGHHVHVVLTAQAPEGGKLPVIFDNSVAVQETGNPGDWPWILARIHALRALKNHIFQRSLTDTCLNLFRQR